MWVGNNWAGTATIVDEDSLEVLKTGVDLVPDKTQELRDIHLSPARLALFLAVRNLPGEGHDQFVDDMFATPDGQHLAVSRPSLGDVVWINIAKATTTGGVDSIAREQSMDGYRTDHMAVSPDGRRLLVSDSTKRQVIEYSMVDETVGSKHIAMGDRLRTFQSGETPHESNYTADGPADLPRLHRQGLHGCRRQPQGPRPRRRQGRSLVRDRQQQRLHHRQALGDGQGARRGRPSRHERGGSTDGPRTRTSGTSTSRCRTSTASSSSTPRRRTSTTRSTTDCAGCPRPSTGAVTRLIDLPNRVPNLPLSKYVNDSAHHGLAMNEAGTTLCAAGTMDDYVALVDRATGAPTFFDSDTTPHVYGKPYWSTEGLNDTCWISLSDTDSVAVIDFDTKQELAYLPVGDHPQRIRHGLVPEATVATW